MSCSMTVDAVKAREKTVTRRHVDTWRSLLPGDRLRLIEKGMGLPKGARQVILAEVEVVAVRIEPLNLMTTAAAYGAAEVIREGLPEMSPGDFVDFWMTGHGYATAKPEHVECRRIEWRYIDEEVAAS
jgi:hypothetical protein